MTSQYNDLKEQLDDAFRRIGVVEPGKDIVSLLWVALLEEIHTVYKDITSVRSYSPFRCKPSSRYNVRSSLN
jgi:hypothetical protein